MIKTKNEKKKIKKSSKANAQTGKKKSEGKKNYISLCNPPENKTEGRSIDSMRNPFQLSVYFLRYYFLHQCDAFKHFLYGERIVFKTLVKAKNEHEKPKP